MATQSLEFGYTPGQTLTAKLFAIGGDTVVQTASSVTERTNAKGRYVAVFTDVPAANYLFVYFLGGIAAGSEKYVVTLETETFQPASEIIITGVSTPDVNVASQDSSVTDEIASAVAQQENIAALLNAWAEEGRLDEALTLIQTTLEAHQETPQYGAT